MNIYTLRPLFLIAVALGFPAVLFAQPTANFTANPTDGCAPLVVIFEDQSTNAVSWEWDLGVTTSNLQNPGVFYPNPGSYTIRLIVTSSNGLKDTLVRTDFIEVYDHPNANFSVDKTTACTFEDIQFSDLSTPGSGSLVNWTWDFGDGNTTNSPSPLHRYTNNGSYPVSFSVMNEYGCIDDTVVAGLMDINAPDAHFTADPTLACGPPLSTQFTSSGTTSGNHYWDFGDGNTSTQLSPLHDYIINGTFDVQHIVEDAQGCRDTLFQPAFVNIGVNTLSVYAEDSTVCLGDTIYFHTNASSNSDVLWDFGFGMTDTAHHPKFVFPNGGNFTVTVNISDLSGCTNTLTLPVTVYDYPIVDFTVADTNLGCELPFEVQYQDLSTDALTWAWHFGDGTIDSTQNPLHTYTQADSFNVKLIVTGPGGCRRQMRKIDYVIVQPIEGGFITDVVGGCDPLDVVFTDTTTSIFSMDTRTWDFGDGNTGTGFEVAHTYNGVGSYDITLITTNVEGCADTVFRPGYITVGVPPFIDFTVDTNIACALEEVQFTNLTQGATKFIWYFGDGDTAMSTHPSHGFAALGDVDVILVASDRGCNDTLIKQDYMHILAPLPIIGISEKKVCEIPRDVIFQNLSLGADNWYWVLETGDTIPDLAFVHTITEEGVFNVSLTVSNDSTGCEVTAEDSVLIKPVIADFVSDTTIGCVDLTIQFTDSSTNAVEWIWEFGTGDSTSKQNPKFTYDEEGLYDVTLLVRNELKCWDTLIQTAMIEALDVEADFQVTSPTAGCVPFAVDFEDLSISTGTIVSWEWDFGDGNTSNAQNPTHTYNAAGDFTVELTVVDDGGCTHTITQDNLIFATQPVAAFGVNPPVNCPDINSTFVSVSSGVGLQYWWDFGDGNGSWLANTFHAYPDTGFYDITLTVTDVNGCKDSLTKSDYVQIQNLSGAFTADTTFAPCPPLEVHFLSDTSFGHYSISWEFDFGDGAISNHPFPTHIYTQAGNYDVQFIISSASGCADTVLMENLIKIGGPKADFTFDPGAGCPGTEIQFTAVSTDSISYEWILGDGNTGFGQSFSHTFYETGTYVPVLAIEDTLGCRVFNASPDSIVIYDKPIADFAANVTMVCDSGDITFIDQSISESAIAEWIWDFGDGDSAFTQFPTHHFSTVGTFDISLVIRNINGCSDTIVWEDLIEVVPSPTLNISVADTNIGCAPLAIDWMASTPGHPYTISSWQWDLGYGGVTVQGPTASFSYSVPGDYLVNLEVVDENGCGADWQDSVTVWSLPVPDFTYDDSLGCAPKSIQFTALVSEPMSSYAWDFGDGNTGSDSITTHPYQDNGHFTVSLLVTDQNGCQGEITKSNRIHLSTPIADFTASDTLICPGSEVQFTDLSSSDTTLIDWFWDFGDGSNATGQNPMHTYTSSGYYTVTLQVTDIFGCTGTETKTDLIHLLDDVPPKILPLEYVSVLNDTSVEILYTAYPNVNGDFGAYAIHRKQPDGSYLEIARINDPTQLRYVDRTAQPNLQSECYKVQVINHCGTASDLAFAPEHCTIDIIATPLMDEVLLTWNAYVGWDQVEQYNIFRVADYETNTLDLIGSAAGTDTFFSDVSTFCYTTYAYRIEAISANHHHSFSDTAYSEPFHNSPNDPGHVNRVSVENNSHVTVEWDLPEVENATDLIIERDHGNGFVEIFRESEKEGNVKFQDQDTEVHERSYEYRIFVMDTCGDFSPGGRTGKSIHLEARQQGGSIRLEWTPYQGWELGVDRYTVQIYDELENRFATLAEVPGTVLEFLDDQTNPEQGNLCYRVIGHESGGDGLDSYSNESCTVLEGQLFGPNAFSPNNDGVNDEFKIAGAFLEEFQIVIYNRWGEKVYEAYSIQDSWDGRDFKGRACPEGVYVYIAGAVDYKQKQVKRIGSVTLIR